MTERDALVRLAFSGAHPGRLRALVEKRGLMETASQVLPVPSDQLTRLKGQGIDLVALGDPGFPPGLADLPDAPLALFVRGILPAEPGVAIVGSRAASSYGLRIAETFGRAVARAGWVVVSGLARGIDGAAHRGVVGNGTGVAVLGSGPDVWYPAEHRPLAETLVAEGGAVVTEYPPGTVPEGWRFPPRNRIISGLSAAVLVVEASVKGGALITARTALEQGRAVFVVPGDIDRETSRGANLLIRDGAHPVLGAEDLVEELSLMMGPPPRRVEEASTGDSLLAAIGPMGSTIEDLVTVTGLSVSGLLVRLGELEASGTIRRSGQTVSLA